MSVTTRPAVRHVSIPERWPVLAGGAFVLALAAVLFRVGADAQWLAALGKVIAHRGTIPAGVPFAFAPTASWPNPIVLAELIFAAFESAFGDAGLMILQLGAVAGALALLARDAHDGRARVPGTMTALVIMGIGTLPSLAIARAQLFSLVLFPALMLLLRSETRRPSSRIWLAVPLLALWSNLHGAALLGLGILVAHLALDRVRRAPRTAVAVALAGALALLVTPAGLRTVDYYHGVLTNVAAQQGGGMWGPLSLHSPLDLVLIAAGLVLVYRAVRARPAVWELAVIAVLTVLTVQAARNGVWLLFFCAVPAARALDPRRAVALLAPAAAVLAILAMAAAVTRGPTPSGAGSSLVAEAITAAHGSPVLADGTIDEQVALAGGRIWAGNPIDAFSRPVQSAYLSFTDGRPAGVAALRPAVRIVVVTRGGAADQLMARQPGFRVAGGDTGAVLYQRRR